MSRSSTKAKYCSMTNVICELTWLFSLFKEFGIVHANHALLYCDNQAALHLVANLVFHKRTKHIEIDSHLI